MADYSLFDFDEFMNRFCERPDVPLVPVSMEIATDRPEFGCWDWELRFSEQAYRHGRVAGTGAGEGREWQVLLGMSEPVDPIPDLHEFVKFLGGDDEYLVWGVDEENSCIVLQVWPLGRNIQLRVFSKGYARDFSHDFLLDRRHFHDVMARAYHSFGKQGGWNGYGYMEWVDDTPVRIARQDMGASGRN